MLRQLFNPPVQMRQGNVIPTVDIDLLNVGILQPRGQDGIFRHFGKESVLQRFARVPRHRIARVVQILCNIRPQFCSLAPVNQCLRIMRGQIPLRQLQERIQFHLFHRITASVTFAIPERYRLSFVG